MRAEGQDATFRIFRGFNDEALGRYANSSFQIDRKSAVHFEGDPLASRIARALGERRATTIKEVLESFETFARTRKRMRASQMADLCCGHGLTGLIFAAFERKVEEVLLLDRERPKRAQLVLDAVVEAAPWVQEKVRYIEDDVKTASHHLAPGTSIVAVHACGTLTDRCIAVARQLESDIAVMPCCYKQTSKRAPRALKKALGGALATDVDRTYKLEAAGYDVSFSAIPTAITPMNRIIIGLRR